MVFLEQDEYRIIRKCITDDGARDLADWMISTGMRWGEATALQVQDLRLTGPVPTANVQRAWKRAPKGSERSFFLGPPKTKKARRLVALAPAQVEGVRRLTQSMPKTAFVFRTPTGKAWRQNNHMPSLPGSVKVCETLPPER